MSFKKISNILIIIFFCLNSINLFSQYSKSHYIPPITTNGSGGAAPEDQYIYISTPSETPVNVTVKPIGGIEVTQTVSNANPWDYYIGSGTNTNLIIRTSQLDGDPFENKGFIIESDSPTYVSVRLFSGGNFQAGTLVSKGTTALGKEFRAGSFENEGFLSGNTPQNYLNFISVLATQDNTIVDFKEFGNGVTVLNNIILKIFY